jgi:hypothetical protein
MRLTSLILFCFYLFLKNSVAFADMECGSEWVSKNSTNFENGNTRENIIKLCGKPTTIQKWDDEIFTKYDNSFTKNIIHYELWKYDRGSHTTIEYLLFNNGMLVDVTDGDYGSD